jgi:hypothetical protein
VTEDAAVAAKAFASSFVETVANAEPAGDPEVQVAFSLGWHMAELYLSGTWPGQPPKADSEQDLPGLSDFSARQRAQLGLDQVDVGLSRLKTPITEHGLPLPTTEEARKALASADEKPFREQIFELHVTLIATLTAASYKLGKSYGLGRALGETTTHPQDMKTLEAKLKPERIENLLSWLSDLTSLFPPHAGHSVRESLTKWTLWAKAPTKNANDDDKDVLRLLRRQGQRWRSLLSGEKQATDTLTLDDYVNAGSQMLKQLGSLAVQFLTRFWVAVVLGVALFLASVVYILIDPNAAHVAAGLGGVLASLGLTWKGVGTSLGKTAGNLERPVWEASLDQQIAETITELPGPAEQRGRLRRRAAPTAPTPTIGS